jgi:DHA2 family multidrug resistance protein
MRFIITMTIMAATLMQTLDTTIANVALPHIQSTVGATQDSINWVLTSYIVAAAIATPLTGWIEGRIGRRKLLLITVIGFTISSAACALSSTLAMIVISRTVQGIFGAFISPVGQAVMLDTYPAEKRAQALTIWGLGVMVGPVLGPMLGGWLTDEYNWRWVFLINIPVGVAAVAGILFSIRDGEGQPRRFDLAGFAMLAAGLAAFQLFLDRGTQLDWFDSYEIIIEILVGVSCLWMFVIHSFTAKAPLFDIGIFRDRNFVIANVFLMVLMGLSMAGAALLTPMLQRLMNYSVVDAGMLVAPRGLAMAVGMVISGRLVNKIDGRLILGTGLLIMGYSQTIMAGFNLEMGSRLVIWSGVVQGFGTGLMMMPLNILAFATLPAHLRTDGAALYSLSRNLGGSVAISASTALLAYNVQVSHSDLTSHLSPTINSALRAGLLENLGFNSDFPLQMLDLEINRQALMIAYLDDYWVMGWAAFLVLPLILIMKGKSKVTREEAMELMSE